MKAKIRQITAAFATCVMVGAMMGALAGVAMAAAPASATGNGPQAHPAVGAGARPEAGAASQPDQQMPLSVLLEKAIYTEQTSGDIDGAMALYRQVIDQAKANRPYVAQAYYRLAMCHLRKGQKDQAAALLRELVSKYPDQGGLTRDAQAELSKLQPAPEAEISELPAEVMGYIIGEHVKTLMEAGQKGLYPNAHVYGVADGQMCVGGFIPFRYQGVQPLTGEVNLGNVSYDDLIVYDENGQNANVRLADRGTGSVGRYALMWDPGRPIQPGEQRLFGWRRTTLKPLERKGDGYALQMRNKLGAPGLESFYLVLMDGQKVLEQPRPADAVAQVAGMDIHRWTDQVPANTNHVVEVVVEAKLPAQAGSAKTELSWDDGTSAGRVSYGDAAHGVRFEAPGGRMLTGVSIYGSRYGYPQPPKEEFQVWIADAQGNRLKELNFPYGQFERGEPRWVRLSIPPTPVPDEFTVWVDFNAEKTQGVYVYHDAAPSDHSLVMRRGAMMASLEPFEAGDWMIRATVQSQTAAGAPTAQLSGADQSAVERTVSAFTNALARGDVLAAEGMTTERFRQNSKDPLGALGAGCDFSQARTYGSVLTGDRVRFVQYPMIVRESRATFYYALELIRSGRVESGWTIDELSFLEDQEDADRFLGVPAPASTKAPPTQVPTLPAVVKTQPQALAQDVDPSLDAITVTFDQPMMDGTWSWTGGGDTYPKVRDKIHYDASRTTCTLPVQLEPGKVYWVGVNSPSHRNFKTPDRTPAQRYVILFATRSADGAPTPIPADMMQRGRQINAANKPSPQPSGRSAPGGEAGADPAEARQVGEQLLSALRGNQVEGAFALATAEYRADHPNSFAELASRLDLSAAKVDQALASGQSACVVLSGLANKADGKLMSMGLGLERRAKQFLIRDVDALPNAKAVGEFTEGFKRSLYEAQPVRQADVDPVYARQAEELSAEGWRLWNQRKLAEAEEKFKTAVMLDPTNANAWNGLGWSQFNQGKPLNATESFEKAVAIDSSLPGALNGLGWVAKQQGRVDEAIGCWEKAIAVAPTATAAYKGLATTYLEQGRYDRAIHYYAAWYLVADLPDMEAEKGLKQAMLKSKPQVYASLDLSSPEAAVRSFTQATAAGDVERAMAAVMPYGHDYEDIREGLSTPDDPIRQVLAAVDAEAPIEVTDLKPTHNAATIAWKVTMKSDVSVGEGPKSLRLKKGDTFKLDATLVKIDDWWLIRGM
jgi:RNA polymerase sigma-70 factor (ECF subfamily)